MDEEASSQSSTAVGIAYNNNDDYGQTLTH